MAKTKTAAPAAKTTEVKKPTVLKGSVTVEFSSTVKKSVLTRLFKDYMAGFAAWTQATGHAECSPESTKVKAPRVTFHE